jgi:hypothetical protein
LLLLEGGLSQLCMHNHSLDCCTLLLQMLSGVVLRHCGAMMTTMHCCCSLLLQMKCGWIVRHKDVLNMLYIQATCKPRCFCCLLQMLSGLTLRHRGATMTTTQCWMRLTAW